MCIPKLEWEDGYYWVRNTLSNGEHIDRMLNVYVIGEEGGYWCEEHYPAGVYYIRANRLGLIEPMIKDWEGLKIAKAISPFRSK